MRKPTLRDSNVFTLPVPAKDRIFYPDKRLPWLKLCVFESGKRIWYVDRRHKGKLHRVPLDDARVLNIAKARQRAQELLGQIGAGVDIKAARQTVAAARMPFSALAEEFFAARRLKQRTIDQYRGSLKRELGELYNKPWPAITPERIRAIHQAKGAKSKRMAEFFAGAVRSVWNWASEKYPSAFAGSNNPTRILSRDKLHFSPSARHVRLESDEIGPWLRELRKAEASDALFLRLLLFVGMRIAEAGRLRWDDINFKTGVATFMSKGRDDARRPTVIGQRLLEELRKAPRTHAPFVFAQPWDTTELYRRRALLDAVCKAAGVQRVTPHDLRRTYGSVLDSLGCGIGPLKVLMGHQKSGDVTINHYIVSDRAAVQSWQQKAEDYLHARIEGAVVVSISKAKRKATRPAA